MTLTIAVIAKECLPGKVKTRLTPPLTQEQAATLAQISLSQTLDTVRDLPAGRRLLVMDGTPLPRDATGFEVHAQETGGLDERLAGICDVATGPLLIIGMDTPQFSAAMIAPLLDGWAERAHLPGYDGPDAWLGPATDGGFWGIAMARPDGRLIRGVPMSQDDTGELQGEAIRSAGLRLSWLEPLTDVDNAVAALVAADACPGSAFALHVAGLPELQDVRDAEQARQADSAAALPAPGAS